jgi:hypothetical protein
MKSNRSLIELATTDCQTPKHFQQMALINNINYHRCWILNGHSTAIQTIFNCIINTLVQMCPSFKLSIDSVLWNHEWFTAFACL